jgi:hypothetical protein
MWGEESQGSRPLVITGVQGSSVDCRTKAEPKPSEPSPRFISRSKRFRVNRAMKR